MADERVVINGSWLKERKNKWAKSYEIRYKLIAGKGHLLLMALRIGPLSKLGKAASLSDPPTSWISAKILRNVLEDERIVSTG